MVSWFRRGGGWAAEGGRLGHSGLMPSSSLKSADNWEEQRRLRSGSAMIRDSHTLPSVWPRSSGELGTLRVAEPCDPVVAGVTDPEMAGNISREASGLDPVRGEPGGKQVRLFHLATGQVSRKQVTVWLHSRQKSQSRAVCTGALPNQAWVEKEKKKEGTLPTSAFSTLV